MNLTFSILFNSWSFGVVLWEIFSLAQRPYRDSINDIVMTHVLSGYRLEKPDACPEELYDLMMLCWNHKPTERPSFLHCLTKLLEAKDMIQISLLNQQITCVHNQSYILNSGKLIHSSFQPQSISNLIRGSNHSSEHSKKFKILKLLNCFLLKNRKLEPKLLSELKPNLR